MSVIMHDAVQAIHRAHHVFAASHIDPDGDALGSLLGFAWTLRRLGKTVTVALADPVPWRFDYLPGAAEIQAAGPAPEHDLLVSLDASDPTRLGAVLRPEDVAGRPWLVIDHHVTNQGFGVVNLIDPQAASTAEIVYFLCLALGVTPDVNIATCLLTGVVTDTVGFRTTNTTPRVLQVAQALMEAGGDLPAIAQRAFNSQTFASLRLTAEALANMRLEDGILWSALTQEAIKRLGVASHETGGLVGYLNAVREANVAIIFREKEDGRIDVSMRAKPDLNIAPVALALGGGGHPQAAGCTLPPPMDAAQQRVLAALRELLAARGT